MRILALEPYHGGSHQAFLDGWIEHSQHDWTVLGLPPFKWKWRMRHAPITFADAVRERVDAGEAWDLVFCSDMLNLPEFLGLAPEAVRRLPTVAYFHENQLTYPCQHEDERDYQYCFSNIATALAADAVWFNSVFHRDEFLGAIPAFLRKMPDCRPAGLPERIREKASVQSPGIPLSTVGGNRHAASGGDGADAGGPEAEKTGRPEPPSPPIHILWAARWEHDKDPGTFFEALDRLDRRGVAFRLSVIGEQFKARPPVFDRARERFADRIVRWGYQESREEYEAALREPDVFVSTAQHEFFGISAVEAVAAGCWPLVPARLAYPETFSRMILYGEGPHFYEGGAEDLAEKLAILAERVGHGDLWDGEPRRGINAIMPHVWPLRADAMDRALTEVSNSAGTPPSP
jgi:glycosyltransferase involved in cell wall biosynthesis